ncbi:GIY-YIG nuclease family protein [Patescibacteria group bacterium]|nr:GIY-YIG nuclease family protein [Patescibacteria group bacterium]MBU2101711.1 GIY-YIG nuclease family protein [Patescibacteria group bacterium]
MYYVYVLENQNDKSLYIGFTTNIEKRVNEHNSGKGSRTTKLKEDWMLIYYESYLNKQDALGREKFLKSGSGRRYINKQLAHYLE